MSAAAAPRTRWWQWLVLAGYLAIVAGGFYWIDHEFGWKNASYWYWLGYLVFLLGGTALMVRLSKWMDVRRKADRDQVDRRRARLAEERERIMQEARARRG